ncbi:hypothetical protein [Borreliella burgdorferi]|uniref:hypothetical protein n=1 Tax=Borreliella burgdorferi TaxID=139 RepID=UPI00016C5603|nr:hypothetical protein [Borreliella burgdorferi]
MLLPAKERASAEEKMASDIQLMYKKFVNEHKSQFEKLNETNRNSLKQMAEKAKDTSKSLYDRMLDGLKAFMKDLSVSCNFLNQDIGESIGEAIHDGHWGEVLEKMSKQMYETWKSGLKAAEKILGPWGEAVAELITALTDFIWGIFKGHEKARIKAVEKNGTKIWRNLKN